MTSGSGKPIRPPTRRVAPDDFLPLKPVDLHVLMVLLDGKRHGYGMVQDIAARTDGKITLVPGNFYAILNRLIELQFIAEAGRPSGKDGDGPRRRYYRITTLGKRVLAAEARRLKALVEEAEARHLLQEFG